MKNNYTYYNGREVKIGDRVVGKSVGGTLVAGTVIGTIDNLEEKSRCEIYVAEHFADPDASIRGGFHKTVSICLASELTHVSDALKGTIL